MTGTLVVPDQPTIFERGDRIYFTAPVQGFTPSDGQIEEYAFSTQVRKQAPNENLLWLKGQYVEADQPNANGAQWRADDIAVKSLTPMLMPVTVMHDPRTAVGTIADAKLRTPDRDQVQRARIDTILAVWEHRFPEVAAEVKANLELGQLMQSMECFSPWYECSSCSMVFHKLPGGQERAQWCEHLQASEGGLVASEQQTTAWRILGDVCFTGVGLIYGTRGARGALSTAHLEEFQEEVAAHHEKVHTDTARTARSHRMGLVQIDEQELATLRRERDEARDKVRDAEAAKADAERKVEEAEAAQKKAEDDKAAAEKEKSELEEQARATQLKDKRIGELGEGFKTKLGDFTRGRLEEQAGSLSDEDWDARLKELEETAGVKRDAKKDEAAGSGGTSGGSSEEAGGSGETPEGFTSEEVAKFVGRSGGNGQPGNGDQAHPAARSAVVGSLVRSMRPKRETAEKS